MTTNFPSNPQIGDTYVVGSVLAVMILRLKPRHTA